MVARQLADQPGLRVGHWTDASAQTGCTVLVFDTPALSAVEVRGAAPGSRELDCLASGRLVQHADAIVLTGGSAFGLATADGVARELASRGVGFQTEAGPVPIVPAAVIYDLAVGQPVAPSADNGAAALQLAVPVSRLPRGRVGAGAGARWNTISGDPRPGGLGVAQRHCGGFLVTAFVVLNALGSVRDMTGDPRDTILTMEVSPPNYRQATTLIAVVTNYPCDHATLTRFCIAAHDALARVVIPAHTMFDGDIAFVSTTSSGPVTAMEQLRLGIAVELAVEAAIVEAAMSGGDTL